MHTVTPLAPGTPAPDLALLSSDGATLQLSSLWRERPVLLFFLRHFGCALCRAELRKLRQRHAEFLERGASVVAIVPYDAAAAAKFARAQRLPFPLLADPGLSAYYAFGLENGSLHEVSGPQVLLRQAAETLRGNLAYINPLGVSIRQLGGLFIVDTQGLARLCHVARPIYNYPPLERYLAVFDELRR
jgi:peroxiredoxin